MTRLRIRPRPRSKKLNPDKIRILMKQEIKNLVKENYMDKIHSIEDLILVLVKAKYKVSKSKKDFCYQFENDIVFGLFGEDGDYPMSPYTGNKICAAVKSNFDKWSTAEILDLEFLGMEPDNLLLTLKEIEHPNFTNP